MVKTLELIFDFASPNAYLVHQILPKIVERSATVATYVPCLLGGIFRATGNSAPMIKNAAIKNIVEYDMLEMRRFIARHAIERWTMNPHFPVNTLLIMRGAIAAELDGDLMRYVDAVMHHMWEEPKNMSDPAVASAALDSSGFDGAALLARTQDPEIKAKLAANTESAVARGAFGIPTFFIGDEMFFGKERLDQVEAMLTQA